MNLELVAPRYPCGVRPVWRRLIFAALLAIPFFWRLAAEEFHGDESHWTSSGQQSFYLLSSGRLDDPQWRDEFYFYSQPQVGKLLIGAALALGGHGGPSRVYDYDWQLKPEENRAAGRVPDPNAVLLARIPGATAGWLSCLLLWAIAAALGVPGAGPLAALLLASHPLWLANARRAGLDATSLCLGLLSCWAVLKTARPAIRIAGQMRWWGLAGLALGLAAADKYVGLLPLGVAVPAVAMAALRSWRRAVEIVGGGLAALAIAGGVFYVSNPALYQQPLYHLEVSVDFLTTQARDMRHDAPAFSSPLFVAVEMFDRAVWPTGDPKIVDHTLPEPLSPGSYGTPAVAIGAALGLLALVLLPPQRRTPLLIAATGTALVYALLALSIPTWWERWHLPLIPPLCLLAGMGLVWLGKHAGRGTAFVLPAAQYVAALAMEPSFLGRGFGALALSPFGAAIHLLAFALVLVSLVSHARRVLSLPALAPFSTWGVEHGFEERGR